MVKPLMLKSETSCRKGTVEISMLHYTYS